MLQFGILPALTGEHINHVGAECWVGLGWLKVLGMLQSERAKLSRVVL